MKNKILTALIVLINIINPAYSIGVSDEIKAGAIFFSKMMAFVFIMSIIIGIGLLILRPFILNFILKKKIGKPNSKTNKFTCEIDDTKNMGEAINTFLTINK